MTTTALYHISALASGFVRMWRGWRVLVPLIVINAIAQALLVWPPFTYDSQWWTILSAVLSALVFGICFGLVASVALQVADGPVTWAMAVQRLRAHLGSYAVWAIAWVVVVSVGLALYTVPGLLIAALTPFLLLASLDGGGNALGRNLTTIGRRFWRWLITVAIIGIVLLVGSTIAGLFTFFMRVPLAALIVWLVAGFLTVWFTTAWALIYRSAQDSASTSV